MGHRAYHGVDATYIPFACGGHAERVRRRQRTDRVQTPRGDRHPTGRRVGGVAGHYGSYPEEGVPPAFPCPDPLGQGSGGRARDDGTCGVRASSCETKDEVVMVMVRRKVSKTPIMVKRRSPTRKVPAGG